MRNGFTTPADSTMFHFYRSPKADADPRQARQFDGSITKAEGTVRSRTRQRRIHLNLRVLTIGFRTKQ